MSPRSRQGRRAGAGLVAVAAAAILTACGASTSTATGTHPAVGSHPAAPSADRPGGGAQPAAGQPGTALRTIDGATVRVPSSRPSVLVFISISCADCSAAAKAVAKARNAIGDKATFLAVDLDPGVPAQDLTSFLDYVHAKGLPTMIDAKAALLAKYKVSALSSVIVIDPANKVTFRAVNPSSDAIIGAVNTTS